jgi:predicted DCC family thiol-disulfide oxidoreductase YuxK
MTPNDESAPQNQPPERPLMLFDGDCGFCRYWVQRWRTKVWRQVDFAPAQQQAARFPQISEDEWHKAVQLVMPDGTVYHGAEAVFRTLATVPEHRWPLAIYEHVPGAKLASESFYRLVADNRNFFSRLTTAFWGRDARPNSNLFSVWLFLRVLGLIYFVAFVSLRVQILGLIGSHGMMPVNQFLQEASRAYGLDAYRVVPTLAWLNSSDAALTLMCSAGALCGLLVSLGLFTAPALALCWLFYLSLSAAGQEFLSFQWDALLLEAGFLSIFLAPRTIVEFPWARRRPGQPPSIILWLQRWLFFRLMFLSGAVKLLSGDPSWRSLTALNYHYWTQPIPTPVGWYAAQLPAWFQILSTAIMFAVELAVPFLIFAPRRFRHFAAMVIASLELLIALTGNYAFFNLLTIALCILLLDDSFFGRSLPQTFNQFSGVSRGVERREPPVRRVAKLALIALAALILVVSGAEIMETFGHANALPVFVRQWTGRIASLELVNSYGLFAVMTTQRVEIVVEGSNDAQNWQPYEFKYKPGNLARRPPWVAPHQPRLDWQMWFAALGNYQQNPWFTNFMLRLLQGSPDVLALLAKNPFPDEPPRYVRAMSYEYHVTDLATKRQTGNWWMREPEGRYFPEVSLRGR